MLAQGPAVKVTVHLNEDAISTQDFLYKEILAFLFKEGVSGASLLKLQSGFGVHHHLHTEGADWDAGEHLPIRIEFIEEPQRAADILPKLCALVTDGMVEMQDTRILKSDPQKNRRFGVSWRLPESHSSSAIFLICLQCWPCNVTPGRLTGPILTLAEAEARAIQNHPRIAAANFRAEAAGRIVAEERSAYYPTLGANLTGAW